MMDQQNNNQGNQNQNQGGTNKGGYVDPKTGRRVPEEGGDAFKKDPNQVPETDKKDNELNEPNESRTDQIP